MIRFLMDVEKLTRCSITSLKISKQSRGKWSKDIHFSRETTDLGKGRYSLYRTDGLLAKKQRNRCLIFSLILSIEQYETALVQPWKPPMNKEKYTPSICLESNPLHPALHQLRSAASALEACRPSPE